MCRTVRFKNRVFAVRAGEVKVARAKFERLIFEKGKKRYVFD